MTLLEDRLSCALYGRETWFAVLLWVLKYCVNDTVLAQSESFEESLFLAHVLKNIRLQVPVENIDGAPCYVFESLLESLDDRQN